MMPSKKIHAIIFCLLLFFLLFTCSISVKAQIANEGADNRIAAGEFLPVSIKLINFGSQKSVDVIVTYSILDSNNKQIYSESETVAVETTASFVKRIQLPYTIKPGMYTLKSSLQYPYQEAPAVSSFPFKVEKKIGSFFISDIILYGSTLAALLLVGLGLIYKLGFISKKPRARLHDYSDKPKDQIIYYEMLSDTVMQMRLRVGDAAVDIATRIDGLTIDEKTGRILKIADDPAKIIATLVSEYEKKLGKKVSFSFRN
jgi:hypothetical protein